MAERDPLLAPETGQQPVHVLVAWLLELVEETRQEVLPRFSQLRERLQSGEFRWECAAFADAILAWTNAVNRLDLKAKRQRGLWANLRGEPERNQQQFNDGVAAIARGAALVREELPLFESACRSQQASRKMLVELEFERKALAQQLEPATAWLAGVAQALRTAAAANAASDSLTAIANQAESLPREIKRLHLTAEAAGAVGALGIKILSHRSEALAAVSALLEEFERSWMHRLAAVTRAPRSVLDMPADSAFAASGIHDELLQRLEAVSELLHELQAEAAEMDSRLWEFAELLA